jgi:hypothetical protein
VGFSKFLTNFAMSAKSWSFSVNSSLKSFPYLKVYLTEVDIDSEQHSFYNFFKLIGRHVDKLGATAFSLDHRIYHYLGQHIQHENLNYTVYKKHNIQYIYIFYI